MKISTRLAIYFSLIASSIFIVFGITVYLFSSNHRTKEFQDRLEERLMITEKIFLEKDSFSPAEYEKIKKQFLNTLPKETEEVIEISTNKSPKFNPHYSPQKQILFIVN